MAVLSPLGAPGPAPGAVAAAVLASCLVWGAAFAFVLERPVTIRPLGDWFAHRRALLHDVPHPFVAVLAGSNGLFSHACETLGPPLRRSCINLSINAEVGLAQQLDDLLAALGPGDLVYLPLEYQAFSGPAGGGRLGSEAPYNLRHDRARLLDAGIVGALESGFSSGLVQVATSLAESALARAGVVQSFGVDDLSEEGDMTGHTRARAVVFRDAIAAASPESPVVAANRPEGHDAEALDRFLAAARRRGATVVGGLPTFFDDLDVPRALRDSLRARFERADQRWLELPGLSRHPRADFYDSAYHLVRERQLEHGRRVGEALARMPGLLAPEF